MAIENNMRLHRFYISENIGNKKEITIESVEQVNQIRRVFRLIVGDLIVVFDGSGNDYECRIENFGKESAQLSIISSSKSRYMPTREIYLCVAVVKKDTFEWIVEKATELGVTNIIPIIAERSLKKSLNMERLEKIAVEASEQNGRGNVPKIYEIISLEESIRFLKEKNISSVVFHTEENFTSISDIRRLSDSNSPVAIIIGPEGGWSPNEISSFHKNSISVFCLGRQVLRTETAVVATLSLMVFAK